MNKYAVLAPDRKTLVRRIASVTGLVAVYTRMPRCAYPWTEPVGLIHCDDAIGLGYPLNRMLKDEDGRIYDVVPGAFFIAGLTKDSFGSLTDALAERFMELFKYPEMYMRTESGHVVCFKVGSPDPPQSIV